MLKLKEKKKLKEAIDFCKNPLVIFDGDPDGSSSFIQFYQYKKEGGGMIIKTTPHITELFVRKVEEYSPDALFIFDIALVDQEFLDRIKIPVHWLDHHDLQDRNKVNYYNPRKHGETTCPTIVLYDLLKKNLWIAAVGAIGDWQMPPYIDEFRKKYPGYIDKKYKIPEDILFNTKLGELIKIISFNLKGSPSDSMNSVKVLTRIEHPDEIMEQTTPKGKFIYKKYQRMADNYNKQLKKAIGKGKKKDPFLIFPYKHEKFSLTKELSNELCYKFPKKIIIVAREKDEKYRISLRSGRKAPPINKALEKALIGIRGYGGGHEKACGANVEKDDFKQFVENLRHELSM